MTVDLRALFIALQTQLTADLGASRTVLTHPGAKGDATEDDWRSMLRNHLPGRYQVDRAFVVDADSATSDFIDLVIYDRQYCPLLFKHGGQLYIPAESVYAAFEIKQTLDKAYIEYAGAKVQSVRKLRRTSAVIVDRGVSHAPRPLFDIMGGVLASESSWSPPFGEAFEQAIQGLDAPARLDLGCALAHGSFEVSYPSGQKATITTSRPETALITFFLALFQRLQSLGTVPAIDLRQYVRALD